MPLGRLVLGRVVKVDE